MSQTYVPLLEEFGDRLVPVEVTLTAGDTVTQLAAADVELAAVRNAERPAADSGWADPTTIGDVWGYLASDLPAGLYTVYARPKNATEDQPISCGKFIVR